MKRFLRGIPGVPSVSLIWMLGIFILTASAARSQSHTLAERFLQLTPAHVWELVDSVALQFNAHHTQGMVKIGEDFYMTAVEVERWPRRFQEKKGKYDRDTGAGMGHLFKFNRQGELLNDLEIGEGSIYHPGGIDFDGENIWIPVCEYRPYGPSNVYKVKVSTLQPEKVFSFDDALGAIAFDKQTKTLVGANWGSRDFYKWKLKKDGTPKKVQSEKQINHSFYIDYQHCYDVGKGFMLCSGLRNYQKGKSEPYALGGLDLIAFEDLRPLHQLPVTLWAASGKVMTSNPSWLELSEKGIRAYFVPDDDENAVLYIYEVAMNP